MPDISPPNPSNESQDSTRTSRDGNILGLSTSQLAGLSVDELEGNKVAITMMMHYYRQLVDENTTLRNETNTLKTYVTGYDNKRSNATIAAGLSMFSNLCIGFGVNILTSSFVTE